MKELNEHENLFCRYYVQTRSAREAAARAGYWINPERSGLKLMAREEIRSKIAQLSEKERQWDDGVAEGLARLAFGGVSDALRLMRRWEEMSDEELERLDLFSVAEVRQLRGGGLEIKFHDRMAALRALREITGETRSERLHPFYKALEQSAAQWQGGDTPCGERD